MIIAYKKMIVRLYGSIFNDHKICMQTISANDILNSFNKTILVWIESLKNYSLDDLQRRPSAGEWSLGQVYQHIIDDTKFFIEQVEACLTANDNSDKEMHEDAKRIFANNSFPAMKLANPNNDINMPQPENKLVLAQQLAAIRNEVTSFNIPDLETCNSKAKHPGLGYFTALEWLQFAGMHMRHHLRQKERIDKVLFEK